MDNLAKIISNFHKKKILIIGDVMLDEYISGKVSRISPESPVQVLLEKERYYKMGGAGNVASNIKSLGGNPFIFSFVGKDNEAGIIKKLFNEEKINYLLEEKDITTRKTRLIGNGQQIMRYDSEDTKTKEFSKEHNKLIKEIAEDSDIIVLSDYAKGTITSNLMDTLNSYRKKIIANPKPINKNLYQGIQLVIANENETREMIPVFGLDILNLGKRLEKELNANILITRGEKGMTLFSNKISEIPTSAIKVYDVQGAGDTVISALALAVSAGASLKEAAKIGNYAAGIAVENKGTYSVKLNELERRILGKNNKLVGLEELKKIVNYSREENKKIVWTNGCFDILHPGHIYSLKLAKEQGDVLIVGLDSDESVKKLKGEGRPILNQDERAEMISSIESVNYVTIFPFGAVPNYLRELKPDVFVKSKGYTLGTLNQEEKKVVNEYGGKLFLCEGIPNMSTTNIIFKIKNNYP